MEGRCLRRPGGYSRNHNPKVLEHPTGLPNSQPSHESPVPGPMKAFVTLKPDSSVERKEKWGGGGGWWHRKGTPRTTKLLKSSPQCHANRAMDTLQAHGTTTHELTKNNAGQSQPQGPHNHMTAANTMECTKC